MDPVPRQVSMDEVRATYKSTDSWWTVLLIDPIAAPVVRFAATRPWITPNLLSGIAFLLGLAAAVAFLAGTPTSLLAGAILYQAGFMIDCVDGKVARLCGNGSIFGGWLDFFLDRIRVMLCVVAIFAGQWTRTDDPVFLFAATGVIFLALFGYVNGAEIDQARAKLAGGKTSLTTQVLGSEAAGRAAGTAARIRAALHRRRIRMNLVSGIEFEMGVLAVAPVASAIFGPYALVVVSAVAAVPLIAFEAALVFRFWLATRAADQADTPSSPPMVRPRRPLSSDPARDRPGSSLG